MLMGHAVGTIPQKGGAGMQHLDGGGVNEGACNKSALVSLCHGRFLKQRVLAAVQERLVTAWISLFARKSMDTLGIRMGLSAAFAWRSTVHGWIMDIGDMSESWSCICFRTYAGNT